LQSNAKYQGLVSDTNRRLGVVQQSLDTAEEKMRALNNKVASLESEKMILTEAEKRLTAEASALSQEKFKIAAELDVLRSQFNQLESTSAQEISKGNAKATKYATDLSDAQRELAVAKGRVEYAHREVAHLKEELKRVTTKFEAKLESTQTDLTEMQRRASAAEAKADLLQEAVRKSEEKVARLEIEKNARVSSAQEVAAGEAAQGVQSPGNTDLKIKELHLEIRVLREELASAQESLAMSTGHAKQFETIAHTAEESLKSSQAEFQKYKIDANNRYVSIEAEVKRLRCEISKKDTVSYTHLTLPTIYSV